MSGHSESDRDIEAVAESVGMSCDCCVRAAYRDALIATIARHGIGRLENYLRTEAER